MSIKQNKSSCPSLAIMGWREIVALPQLGIKEIKAKIDTGARSSALHAFNLHKFERNGIDMIRFQVHPYQRDSHTTITTEAKILDHRHVTSSSGHAQLRPTIQTVVELGGKQWMIELTLTNRDVMGFRMLLGRQAIRKKFLVDASASYLQSKAISRHK